MDRTMQDKTALSACEEREIKERVMGAHPLELIPYFRRFPRSIPRDIVYTFIWSGLFAFFFIAIAMVSAGRVPSLKWIGYNFVLANCIGYSIHLIFHFTGRRIEPWIRTKGFVVIAVFYAGVTTIGVVIGITMAQAILDIRLVTTLANPGWLVSIAATSMVISIVLTIIFFFRERSAIAEAHLERERLRMAYIEREAMFANLKALQAQIEPHFLFNTLANVVGLVDSDPAKAKHMLESFIRFLRSSLAATRQERTTLGDDFALIASFLEVIQVRMGERLAVKMEIPESLRSFELPPLLLQPIVENAVRHGLEPKVEGGTIALTASERAGRVVIEVADTGVGFRETTSGGIGLSNIRDRLKLQYGDDARLAIRDNPPMGTVVAIELPKDAP
jgi:signal transduction histidine kinase